MWDGSLLYLLIDVTDAGLTADSVNPANKDGVEIYLDLWNDKFPKYEEDDGMMRISMAGQLSGSGGAAPFRYDSFGNTPARKAPFGNVYPWGASTGAEVLGDHVRHQGHNSNEMLARFLDPVRMYKTRTHGYGERLPFDHHELIAAIAPRAVIITTTNDDYSNNAEGDSIGFAGAQPVYAFLGAIQNLAFDIRMTGGGHSLGPAQRQNLVSSADMVFFGKPMSEQLKTDLYDNPYVGMYTKYYGGLKAMMPWLDKVPRQ